MHREVIKTVLIDDDLSARRELRELLADFDDVQVVGEASSVAEGIRLVNDRDPALVLLEPNLPVRSGFELLPYLGAQTQAVFVTAFDAYAVRAFEFNVIDYLLKPMDRDRLRMAINRVHRARDEPPHQMTEDLSSGSDEIVLQADGNVHVVSTATITCIKAVGNYTQANLVGGKRLLVRRSMDSWLEDLPDRRFCRPHRSLIVNLQLMKGMVRHSRDSSEVQISGYDTSVSVGRRGALLLQRALKQLQREPVAAFG